MSNRAGHWMQYKLWTHKLVLQINAFYKGFPTFVKQFPLVVNRAAIDHET